MSISSPDKKNVTTDSAVSLRMASPTMISTAPSFPTIITPRNAIAADFIRTVFRDCEWRNDYSPMLKLLLVCKDWFELATSLLWGKVTINSQAAAKKFLQCISSPERGHLYKRYMRALDARERCNFRSKPSEQWVRSVCTCLETGAPLFSELGGWFWRMDSFVDTIGPTLRRQLEGLTISSLRGEELQLFPNLKRLYSHTEYTDPSIFVNFIAFAPQLTRISIWLHPDNGPRSIRLLESLVNVENIKIIFDAGELTPEERLLDDAVCRAFQNVSRIFFPKLTSLKIHADEFCHASQFWWSSQTLFAFFQRTRKTLTKVHLGLSCFAGLRVLSYTGDPQNRKNYVLKELELPYNPVETIEINFDNFKALEYIHIVGSVDQMPLIKIATSCGDRLRRFSLEVDVDVQVSTLTGERESQASMMKQFLDACPHLEELTLQIWGACGGDTIDEHLRAGVAHTKLRVLRVIMVGDCVASEDERNEMMTKIWSQCPKLYNIFWNGVCYGRHQ